MTSVRYRLWAFGPVLLLTACLVSGCASEPVADTLASLGPLSVNMSYSECIRMLGEPSQEVLLFDEGRYCQYSVAEGINLIVAFDQDGVCDIRVERVRDGRLIMSDVEGVGGEGVEYEVKQLCTLRQVYIGSSVKAVLKQYGKPCSDWIVGGIRNLQYRNDGADTGAIFAIIDERVVGILVGRPSTVWPN